MYSVVKTFTSATITEGSTGFLDCDQEVQITFHRGCISNYPSGTSYYSTITLNSINRPPAVTLSNSSGLTYLSGSYQEGQTIKQSVKGGTNVALYSYWKQGDGSGDFTYDFPMSLTYSKLSGYVNSNS